MNSNKSTACPPSTALFHKVVETSETESTSTGTIWNLTVALNRNRERSATAGFRASSKYSTSKMGQNPPEINSASIINRAVNTSGTMSCAAVVNSENSVTDSKEAGLGKKPGESSRTGNTFTNNQNSTESIGDDKNIELTLMAGRLRQMYDGTANIKNEDGFPDINSLSISDENISKADSPEKPIKPNDSAFEATTLPLMGGRENQERALNTSTLMRTQDANANGEADSPYFDFFMILPNEIKLRILNSCDLDTIINLQDAYGIENDLYLKEKLKQYVNNANDSKIFGALNDVFKKYTGLISILPSSFLNYVNEKSESDYYSRLFAFLCLLVDSKKLPNPTLGSLKNLGSDDKPIKSVKIISDQQFATIDYEGKILIRNLHNPVSEESPAISLDHYGSVAVESENDSRSYMVKAYEKLRKYSFNPSDTAENEIISIHKQLDDRLITTSSTRTLIWDLQASPPSCKKLPVFYKYNYHIDISESNLVTYYKGSITRFDLKKGFEGEKIAKKKIAMTNGRAIISKIKQIRNQYVASIEYSNPDSEYVNDQWSLSFLKLSSNSSLKNSDNLYAVQSIKPFKSILNIMKTRHVVVSSGKIIYLWRSPSDTRYSTLKSSGSFINKLKDLGDGLLASISPDKIEIWNLLSPNLSCISSMEPTDQYHVHVYSMVEESFTSIFFRFTTNLCAVIRTGFDNNESYSKLDVYEISQQQKNKNPEPISILKIPRYFSDSDFHPFLDKLLIVENSRQDPGNNITSFKVLDLFSPPSFTCDSNS